MKVILALFLILFCQNAYCQKDESPVLNSVLVKIVNDTPLKSKSRCTPKPTVIIVKRGDIKDFTRIQDFISQIPANCDISSCELTFKKGEQIMTRINIGNNLMISTNPSVCKFIILENIVSSCPTLHYANYKIIIQD